jgi:hypothetical protein
MENGGGAKSQSLTAEVSGLGQGTDLSTELLVTCHKAVKAEWELADESTS